jgi:glycosyltransferase involved in cell wall biosynthesis
VNDATPAPAIGILLCLYNGERHLAAALDSVFEQSCSDFELIAVDDGSTDGSAQLVESYRDPRVCLIRQERTGAAGALNIALRAARSEYVALLDQDDIWRKDKLAAHLETHRRHPEIDMTFSWFRVINDAGRENGLHSNRYRGTVDFRGLLANFVIGASSNVVIRRQAIEQAGGVDISLPRFYDFDLCLRVALLAPRNVLAIGQDLMLYRRHDVQITRDLTALEGEWEQTLRKFEALVPNEFRQLAGEARSNMDRYFAFLAYEARSYGRALKFLKRGWRRSPGRFIAEPRNWLALAACASGFLFPADLHRKLEHLAGLNR